MVRSILHVMMALIVITGKGTFNLPEFASNETAVRTDMSVTDNEEKRPEKSEVNKEAEKETVKEIEEKTEEETISAVINTNISEKEAMAIGEEWAKKDAYIYDDWREQWGYEYSFVACGARLCATEDTLLDVGFGRGYIYTDEENHPLYYGQPVWFVFLNAENDPLVSLFFYVDADTGVVVGCNAVSD